MSSEEDWEEEDSEEASKEVEEDFSEEEAEEDSSEEVVSEVAMEEVVSSLAEEDASLEESVTGEKEMIEHPAKEATRERAKTRMGLRISVRPFADRPFLFYEFVISGRKGEQLLTEHLRPFLGMG